MFRKKEILLLGLTLSFCSLLYAQSDLRDLRLADDLYFLEDPTEAEEYRALALYEGVLAFTPDLEDALGFVLACERAGNLCQSLRKTEKAKYWYKRGIELARAFGLSDTLVYGHHLYLGETNFELNQFDSSLYHLQKAERIQADMKKEIQPERLYNAFGVYFFETGNYNRSISYFTKANSYLKEEDPNHIYARYSFLNNTASALNRMGKIKAAQSIYLDLLALGINEDQLLLNLANTYIEEKVPKSALEVLGKVSPDFADRSLAFQNLKAKAWLANKDWDSLELTLAKGRELISSELSDRKNFQKAIYFTVSGDYSRVRGNELKAIEYYQRAIEELHPTYASEGILENPREFPFGISFLPLFDVLTKKAQASWEIYESEGDKKWFDLGVNTWESAFGLASFVSANYDNDEARVFLGDRVLEGYREYLDGLFALSSPDQLSSTMREIFSVSERSKSEALKIGRDQEIKKRQSGIPKYLIEEEKNILNALSRVRHQQFNSNSTSEVLLADMDRKLVDLQVRLSRLREEFRKIQGFTEIENQKIQLETLQQNLGKSHALLTFFISQKYLFVFFITKTSFQCKVIPLEKIPFGPLEDWLQGIKNPRSLSRWNTPKAIHDFSLLVFGDFQKSLEKSKELIIIPHDILNSFPFELLPFGGSEFLLEVLPVTYQYSSAGINRVDTPTKNKGILAFAPFLGEEIFGNSSGLSRLPGSFEEVKNLKGQILLGKEANREAFLNRAHQAGILHLATHAVVSSDDPNEAFIAFYPEEEEFRIFAPELAFQNLENTRLVYLSACETGAGILSKSEGIISLARSLSIAGVPQLVFSQWVSEDRVSAFVAQRFYRNLERGDTYSDALRKAKLALLLDPSMAQFHHPFYWANFRVIGRPVPDKEENWSMMHLILVFSVGLMLFLIGVLVLIRR